MRGGKRRWKKAEKQILERIGGRVGMDPINFDGVWFQGGLRDPPAPQLAGAIGALGLWFLSVCADLANDDGGTRYFEDAITADNGERAALWLAHAIARPFPNAPARPAFDSAYAALQAQLPIPENDVRVLDDIIERCTASEYGFDPRDIYGELSYNALGVVVGSKVDELPGFAAREATDEYLVATRWGISWGHGNRYFFQLVDPAGYDEWAKDKDLN